MRSWSADCQERGNARASGLAGVIQIAGLLPAEMMSAWPLSSTGGVFGYSRVSVVRKHPPVKLSRVEAHVAESSSHAQAATLPGQPISKRQRQLTFRELGHVLAVRR